MCSFALGVAIYSMIGHPPKIIIIFRKSFDNEKTLTATARDELLPPGSFIRCFLIFHLGRSAGILGVGSRKEDGALACWVGLEAFTCPI
jgi:hypothetical protein